MITGGKFTYHTDAALGAGGFAEHPKHVDYLLGDECADGFIRSES
jgi:hypothetical protein